jgi:ornithine decarboxylase
VKCNPECGLLKRLAQNGAGFDCASLGELRTVLTLGISASRIIYTNPVKTPTSLRFARKVGVRYLVFDNDEEVQKIKDIYPEATLLLRIAVKNPSAVIQLGDKFGAESPSSLCLLRKAVELGMDVAGISFHVGG